MADTNKNKISEKDKILLDFIASGEGDYDMAFGGKRYDLTNMTVKQVRDLQKKLVKEGSPSSAMGRYQFMGYTLDGLIKSKKLKETDKFDIDTQDRLALELANRRGYQKFKSGDISYEDFQNNLAKEWASIPTTNGNSYYDKDGLNKANKSVQQVRETLGRIRGEAIDTNSIGGEALKAGIEAEFNGIGDNGYSPEMIDALANSGPNINPGQGSNINLEEPIQDSNIEEYNLNSRGHLNTFYGISEPSINPQDTEALASNMGNPDMNQARLGGLQLTNRFENGGLLNEFNEGGKHEENPIGGIPQGIGSNGNLNTVEEGETKFGNYVFSDTLKLSKEDVNNLFLPKKLEGKTYAEASKYLNKFIEDDPGNTITRTTIKKQLDSLILGNEKAKSLYQDNSDLNLSNQNQMFLGGDERDSPSFNINETYNPNSPNNNPNLTNNNFNPSTGTMGFDISNPNAPSSDAGIGGGSGGFWSGGSAMSAVGSGLSAVGGALSAGNTLEDREQNKNAEIGWKDDVLERDAKNKKTADMVQDTVASAFGPYGMLFRGIQKAGGGLGDAIGGDVGLAVSNLFNPLGATLSNIFTSETNVGEKILGTVPILGGFMSRNRARKRRGREEDRQQLYRANSLVNDFKLGGKLNQYRDGGRTESELDYMERLEGGFGEGYNLNDPILRNMWGLNNTSYNGPSNNAPGVYVNPMDEPDPSELFPRQKTQDPYLQEYYRNSYPSTPMPPEGGSLPDDKVLKEKPGHVFSKGVHPLQYTNILGSYLNYRDARKLRPEVERLNRIDTRISPYLIDEAALLANAQNAMNTSVNAITNASGGSGSAVRAGILASGLNYNRGLSEATLQAQNYNNAQRLQADQLNLQTNQFNIGQDNQERDINARNRAMVRNAKQEARAALFDSISGVGKELTYDRRIRALTGGYDNSTYNPEQRNMMLDYLKFLQK